MENHQEKRKLERVPDQADIDVTVLSTQENVLHRIKSSCTIIDTCADGVGMLTPVNLEPGDVIEWDDRHEKGKLHIAMVKWCLKQDNCNRAGLLFV